MTTLPSAISISPESNLQRYLQEIRRFPMLEKEQEYMLAKRWLEHNDTNSAHQMVTSHLRLVSKIASGYRGYGLPLAELISEGNIGLMQAVKRFDRSGFPSRDLRHVVDSGVDPRIYSAFLVASENWHHGCERSCSSICVS